MLESKGLKVKKSEHDSTLAKDQVINSNPPPGESVDFGSTVTLLVSKGQSTVPNVVGLTKEEAISKLEDAGLKVRSSRIPHRRHRRTRSPPRTSRRARSVAPDTTVTITVSTNPVPPTTTTTKVRSVGLGRGARA